ncbi:hypothetical protein DVR12_23555 [Chitinophaga silvatica]|uniref:PDZ domain-containing protein n=1 Tax=Chitinophaga silvatica TaxID=2282649 RepID=A0A3E1Y4I8_9BACT|nr:S41 family peptidase [Chitinophaga silvatica]RFS19605.1 hypothetical protein DVR12_23555 [Chitinophaga silvatica]
MHKKLFSSGVKGVLAACIFAGVLTSCHKDKPAANNDNNNPAPSVSTGDTTAIKEDSLRYLMYQIMQVTYADGGRTANRGLPTYYWYSSVPVLNPFDTKFANADSLLAAMKRYAINPTTNAPYDRYSFLDRSGVLTNKLMNGVSSSTTYFSASGDLGLQYAPVLADANGTVRIFVLYTDKNSPAGKAGVTRGWEITGINGVTSFSSTSSSLSYIYRSIMESDNVSLEFKRPDGTKVTYALAQSTYNINPVVFDTVFSVPVGLSTQKVGYFVFYTYASTFNANGQPTVTKTELDKVFTKFQSAGIKNLIVDLRYNGGGATTTAEYLDSAIAPSSAANNLMYSYQYNDKLMAVINDIQLTSKVNFPSQTGGLQLDNVFFVVSRNTASASELTINNLKPYMSVKLIGDSTYGKPVGFIDFNITMYDANHQQKYLADLYAINFETKNAKGEGGYYTGMAANTFANDYVNVPWGSTSDQNLQQAVSFISDGKFQTINKNARAAREAVNLFTPIEKATPLSTFNGMVDFRLSKEARRR